MNDVWNKLASLHYQQLNSGKDLTFHRVFLPAIINILQMDSKFDSYYVLDAGCGTGYLTNLVSKYAHKIVGIDSSAAAIEIAKQHERGNNKISFELTAIREYTEPHKNQFDFVISHLVLHVIENLDSTLKSISGCIKKSGGFLFSIPHPCFWALTGEVGTWNFKKINDYQYHINSTQENSIRIGGEEFSTPHYHRAIETYSSSLNKSGFVVERIIEPIPDEKLIREHNKKAWPYPRFLFTLCRKNREQGDLNEYNI